MRKITPFGWLTLKTLLLRCPIKFNIFFLKVEYEGEFQIYESNFFHSTNADGKELKKAIPYFKLKKNQVLSMSCSV